MRARTKEWGTRALLSTPRVLRLFGSPRLHPRGRGPGSPILGAAAVPPLERSLPNFAAPTARRARAPEPGAEPGRASAGLCGDAGTRVAGAQWAEPPALGGARRAGYKASARWSLRLLLAQSISARRSSGRPRGPASSPAVAAGHTSLRPPAPGTGPRANFAIAGPIEGATRGRGGRSPPPSPLTFYGG